MLKSIPGPAEVVAMNAHLAVGLFVVLLGLAMLGAGLQRLRLRRTIKDIELSSASAIQPGLVKLRGRVVSGGELLESPLEGKACVHYSFAICEKRWALKQARTGRGSTLSRNRYAIRNGTRTIPFLLEDESGRTHVIPDGAEIRIEQDHSSDSGFLDDPSERIIQYLKSEGLSHEGALGMNKKLSFEERQISVGEDIYVLGRATNEGSQPGNPTPFTIAGHRSSRFLISNRPSEEILAREMSGAHLRLSLGLLLTVLGCIVATAV